MSSDRRFSQKEIAVIFKKASEDQERIKERAASEDGLTLEDLHLIAKEAGIAPELITAAAGRIEQEVETPPAKRFLGFPISVHRIVDLGGHLSDEDWDKLVIEIRQAFSARGKVTRDGGLREWSNGNLHILVEPTEKGHRLRMGTIKQSAKGFLSASLSWVGVAIFMLLSILATSSLDAAALVMVVAFALAGLGGIGFTGLHLSQWRYDRADQMDSIASKALDIISKGSLSPSQTPVHEDITANHGHETSETAGLDVEYYDRPINDHLLGLEDEPTTIDDLSSDSEASRSKKSRA